MPESVGGQGSDFGRFKPGGQSIAPTLLSVPPPIPPRFKDLPTSLEREVRVPYFFISVANFIFSCLDRYTTMGHKPLIMKLNSNFFTRFYHG